MCAYSLLGGVVVSGAYILFIVPNPHPDFSSADFALGAVYSLLYAELAAISLVATVRSKERTNQVSKEISEFLEISNDMKEGTKSVDENTPDRLVELARSIANSIRAEPASGTEKIAERLNKWADSFDDENDYKGRKEHLQSDEFSQLADNLCTLR